MEVSDTDASASRIEETYAEALMAASEALRRYQTSGDSQKIPAALNLVAEVHCKHRKPDEAKLVASDALAMSRITGDKVSEAAALNTLAKVSLAKNPEAALRGANDALALFRDAQDVEGQAASLHIISLASFNEGGVEEAFRAAEEAVNVLRNAHHDAGQAAALVDLAELHLFMDENKESLSVARQAAQLFQKIGDKQKGARALQTAATALMTKGKIKGEALDLAEESRDLYRQAGDSRGEAAVLFTLAHANLMMKSYDKALQFAEESAEAFNKLEDRANEAATLLELANAHLARMEENKDPCDGTYAIRAARDAARLYRSVSDERGEVEALHALANAQVSEELYYQATESAEEGRRLAHKLGDQTLEGSALIVIARTHWADRDAQRAIGFAREAEALFREARDHQNTRVAVQLVQWFEKQSRGVKLSSGAEGSSAKPVATPARLDEVKVS